MCRRRAEARLARGDPRATSPVAAWRRPVACRRRGPRPGHLAALRRLADRFEPFVISEHLAWSQRGEVYHPDLLPFPRSREALDTDRRQCRSHPGRAGRRILIENPSLYVGAGRPRVRRGGIPDRACSPDRLRPPGRRQQRPCQRQQPRASAPRITIDAVPRRWSAKSTLAGHAADEKVGDVAADRYPWRARRRERVDTYRRLIDRIGPRPTLVERDDNIPAFEDLIADARPGGLIPGQACPGGAGLCVGSAEFPEGVRRRLRAMTAPSRPGSRAVAEAPGLAVYRNTVTRGSIDVLASTFSPVVRR